MSETYISVVTEELITCGTSFGPLPLTSGSPDSLAVLTWRCVDDLPLSKQVLKVSLWDQNNGRGVTKAPSWLAHILPARKPDEQTLEIVAKSGRLYFRALRDIVAGEELRAWFGQELADILKLPMIPPNVVEGEKRFECMLCQERFENPFPVVAHLMYRCRRKDHGIMNVQSSIKKKNGGRVKNFDIATLTDMNDNESNPQEKAVSPVALTSLPLEVAKSLSEDRQEHPVGSSKKRHKKVESSEEFSIPSKKILTHEEGENESVQMKELPSEVKPQNGVLKLTSKSDSSSFIPPVYTGVDLTSNDNNNTSAFKKVDKTNSSLHSGIPSFSGLFAGSLDHRDILFQSGTNFSPFPYPLTTASSYVGMPPSRAGLAHSNLTAQSMDGHMTSAFVPSTKHNSDVADSIHHQLKMAEDFKIMRKLPETGYELMPPSVNEHRMSMHYAPKPRTMDSFGGSKSFPTPLLPFLPPSLAALSFPTQNWCAKCNASFRMTSDLVYHMRSHHKRETDPQKLKREEKLRCHICNETFRERHHLTRHMTSHQ